MRSVITRRRPFLVARCPACGGPGHSRPSSATRHAYAGCRSCGCVVHGETQYEARQDWDSFVAACIARTHTPPGAP